ncbi:MAG: hypothetical protein S4CHLAM81_15040 [Chlamydiales bacterium]|nr:hypothetical protein [Chlamydiales bacterium]MCH9636273.1 hypothetical protein [Chlamydiales bacterium]
MAVSDQEWNDALEEEVKEEAAPTSSREMVALLLLLPGIVFFLFGMLLLLFAKEGMLTLHWKQSLAFFYFLASLPLLYLGWRATR